MARVTMPGGDGVYWEDVAEAIDGMTDELYTGKQDILGTVGAAGAYLIEESALGVKSMKVPGNWKLFYTDGSAAGIKEIAIGSIGSFLMSNGTGGAPSWELPSATKIKFTPEGGLAIKLTNLGPTSVKGYLASVAPGGTNNGVTLTSVGSPDCIGVFYDTGVAEDEEAWIVVSGIADVYFWTDTVNGHFARVGHSTDTGEETGQAISETVPGTPFATDKHFMEIGHVLESRTGAGLAKVVLHFN
jgi:hypothetical protein